MASRPQGTKYKKCGGIGSVANTLVMTGIGNLYSVFISHKALTVGNRITIHDGITGAGAVIEEIIITAADNEGFNIQMPSVGKEFGTGLYVNFNGVDAGEVNVSLGYDGNG